MATVRREFDVQVAADEAWAAVRDTGAVHTRLAPGFVVDTSLDGDGVRTVTFANGLVVSERILSVDDDTRRLAYTVVNGTASHHNASFEVRGDEAGGRIVWTTDVHPNEAAEPIGRMMDAGIPAIQAALATTRRRPAAPRR